MGTRPVAAAVVSLAAALLVVSGVGAQRDQAQAGGQIALAIEKDGNKDIYVVNADGSGLEKLTSEKADDRFPVWSRRNA